MAGPPEAVKVTPPPPRNAYDGPLGSLGWGIEWLDFAVYSVERIVVVTALIAMTIIEFIYILSLYVTEQTINFRRLVDPTLEAEFPYGLLVLGGFVALMMAAAVNNTIIGVDKEGNKRSIALRGLAVAGLVLFIVGVSALTALLEESSSFYIVLVTLIMVPATGYFFKTGAKLSAYLMVGFTVLAYAAAYAVPSGYSWADKRALFLLLWVGFLGASMAAKQKRHIKIDAVRKLIPAKHMARFNGVSFLVAAGFTGLLLYIGGIYLFNEDYGRFWASTIPGEIPDWLKVASIPLAFLLITIRFACRGVRLLVWGEPAPKGAAPIQDESGGEADTP